MTTSTPALASQRQWFGHPLGLYVCFFTEMWERFAFYGLKALLFLYLTKHHLFSDNDGYLLLGTYAGLAYALPVVGGLLADKYLGMRKAVTFGGALMAAVSPLAFLPVLSSLVRNAYLMIMVWPGQILMK